MGKGSAAGRGQVNIPAFVQTLKKVGYRGPLCIEREVGDQEGACATSPTGCRCCGSVWRSDEARSRGDPQGQRQPRATLRSPLSYFASTSSVKSWTVSPSFSVISSPLLLLAVR